jgi:hypothetical protein
MWLLPAHPPRVLILWMLPDKPNRIALTRAGLLVPSRKGEPPDVEVEYWAIDRLYLRKNCIGRKFIICHSVAEFMLVDHFPSRDAFKDFRRLLADRIFQARRERGLPPASRTER